MLAVEQIDVDAARRIVVRGDGHDVTLSLTLPLGLVARS
jgi:hypothetical protein